MSILADPRDVSITEKNSHPLSSLFAPRSIALVGATEKSIWTHFIMRNFKDIGFGGEVYAVNRGGNSVLGYPGFSSCREIGAPVDVGFITVPKSVVADALDDLAAAGIANAVILTSGYGEMGEEGARDQDALVAKARSLGIRVWGPNTLGFNNVAGRAPVSAIPIVKPVLPPSIAIVSQSGASASEIAEYAHSQNIGLSFVAATGNQGDITMSDVIDYLVDDEQTKAIAVFAENICDPEKFVAAAEKARRKAKPIVMLKIGRSELAGAIAAAHTGSLLGNDGVFAAVCERLGIIRVFSTEELIDVAGLLGATGPIPDAGLSFISISGGACTLVADSAEDHGVDLPANDPATAQKLGEVLPDFAAGLNPLDITGAAIRDPDLFERVIPIMANATGIGLVAINMPVPTMDGQSVPAALAAIGRACKSIVKPVIMAQTCAKALNDTSRQSIAEYGLPHVMTGLEGTLRAIGKAIWWSSQIERDLPSLSFVAKGETGEKVPTRNLHSEYDVLAYLRGCGVPVVAFELVTSRAEAIAAAGRWGGEVVLKIASPDIGHKTEVGGVRLNLTADSIGAVFDEMLETVRSLRPDAAINGAIVAPMRSDPAVELLVSYSNDPVWGGMLTIGLGGSMVELMGDAMTVPMPVDRSAVQDMIGKLRGAPLLKGFRGSAPVDLAKLADAIVAIANAAESLGPELASLEINPLLASGLRIEALDGLATWHEKGNGDAD
ncbi:acetate--CoA ligase family protein [Croceicoccus sediminis]|uniref:acetate--CoA ligase family protein n=1 Tax=Croceicoccus sediminis TaxID=2571150 RepID=UPI001181D178|nr:acetate--CoA ligase family protein [Croceicoccus sediminis]